MAPRPVTPVQISVPSSRHIFLTNYKIHKKHLEVNKALNTKQQALAVKSGSHHGCGRWKGRRGSNGHQFWFLNLSFSIFGINALFQALSKQTSLTAVAGLGCLKHIFKCPHNNPPICPWPLRQCMRGHSLHFVSCLIPVSRTWLAGTCLTIHWTENLFPRKKTIQTSSTLSHLLSQLTTEPCHQGTLEGTIAVAK
jgi:hypothetical protein